MKRRLVYLVLFIAILFVGLTSYYFARNIETVALTIAENGVVQLNVGEEYSLPFIHENPNKNTIVSVNIADTELVTYDETTKVFTANLIKGGTTIVTISTTNTKLPTYSFTVRVGNGSVQNPFFVKTAVQLAKIGNDLSWTVNCSYLVDCDIDLSVIEGNWKPIGTEAAPFTGLFDGNFKTISNLKIVDGTHDYAGLFGVVSESATIEYVKIKDTNITGTFTAVGTLVGLSKGAVISKNEVWNELATVSITNNNGIVGGVVGKAVFNEDIKPSISTCSAKEMILNGETVGGIVGFGIATVVNDCFTSNCSLSSSTLETACIGGIAGELQNALNSKGYQRNSVVKNTYSTSFTNVTENFFGGIIGKTIISSTFINGNYYLSNKGFSFPVGSGIVEAERAKALTSEEMQTETNFVTFEGNDVPATETEIVSWDFENIWVLTEVFPTLNYESDATKPRVFEQGDTIMTLSDLQSISEYPTGDFVLGADIIVNDWTPINYFNGSLDGKTFKLKTINLKEYLNASSLFVVLGRNALITNLTLEGVTVSEGFNKAVVAYYNQGTISNVTISDLVITNSTEVDSLGGVAVYNSGKIMNCDIVVGEAVNTFTLSNVGVVGGIVATNYGFVSDSTISAQIVINNPNYNLTYGGIVADQDNDSAVISNCGFVSGKIETNSNHIVIGGGVVGYNYSGKITKSFIFALNTCETANVESYNGGIVGVISGGELSDSYAYGNVSGYNVGGIVGKANQSFTSSYFNGEATGVIVGGLASRIQGENVSVTNSYAVGSVVGKNASSIVAGYASYIENYSVVEHCFVSVSIGGYGDKWQETKSAIGLVSNPVWNNTAGFVRNSIFNESLSASAQDQTRFFLWPPFKREGTNIIENTKTSVCRGESGNFSNFTDSAGFDLSVWRFVEGNFPELKTCDFGEIIQPSQIVEEE
ncbi:MAG: hypothetical protein WCR30_04745 [Clostridia bacterium]